MAEVTIVDAHPGWDVLFYNGDGAFDNTRVIAWAITFDPDTGETLAIDPIIPEASWPLDRPVCSPDGEVVWGDERWANVWIWADDMKLREKEPDSPQRPTPGTPIVLDAYRTKFRKGEAS